MALNIVLFQPEIPQNTGNIARTCAATGSRLHLIRPLGFSTDDKKLKRAGLDYWSFVDIHYYDDFEHFSQTHANGRFFYVETTGERYYHEVAFQDEDFLVLGKETTGLPSDLLQQNPEHVIKLPMQKHATRSLNLANATAVVLFEALRQLEFPALK